MSLEYPAIRAEQNAPQELRLVDKSLIEHIAGSPINDQWYEAAAYSYRKGSERLDGLSCDRDEILRARNDFYENRLGFADESHPLNSVYTKVKEVGNAPLPSTFLATQQLFASYGLDGVEVCKMKPVTFKLSAQSIEEKLLLIQRFDIDPSNYRAVGLLNRSPAAIEAVLVPTEAATSAASRPTERSGYITISEQKLARRQQRVTRYAETLKYPGDVSELSSDELVLAYADTRLRLVARLLGTYANRSEVDLKEIRNFLTKPIEAHFMTIVEGEPYNSRNVSRSFKALRTAKDRKEWLADTFPDRESMISVLGLKVVIAYEAHVKQARPKSLEASQRSRSRKPRFSSTL